MKICQKTLSSHFWEKKYSMYFGMFFFSIFLMSLMISIYTNETKIELVNLVHENPCEMRGCILLRLGIFFDKFIWIYYFMNKI